MRNTGPLIGCSCHYCRQKLEPLKLIGAIGMIAMLSFALWLLVR